MIGKYLYELLKINSRVIIPDFGAFLIKEKPGGKMEVSYNDFLKFNDGLLLNKIIKAEGINKTDATKKIKDFIQEMEDKFKANERYAVESIGIFYKDDANRVKFDPYREVKNITTRAVKPGEDSKEDKKTKEPVVKAPEKAKEAKKEEKEKPTTAPQAATKITKEPEAKKEVVKESKQITPEAIKKPEVKKEEPKAAKPIIQEPVKKPEIKKEEKTPAPPVKEIAKPKAKSSSGTGGNKTLIWVSAIVVVIAAIITWGVFDYDRISGWFSKEKEVKVEKPIEKPIEKPTKTPQKIEVAEEAVPVEEKVEEEVVEEVPVKEVIREEPVSTGLKYYVIAGSFKVESNAVNYNNRLRADGFNSENLGMINGFYMVSFDGFTEYEDALKLWKMEKAGQPDAWIMKY